MTDVNVSSPTLGLCSASAPSKLIVAGEYAVLEGEPALVMAVDRSLAITLEPLACGEWEVFAPGFNASCVRLHSAPAGFVCDRPDYAVFLSLFNGLLEHHALKECFRAQGWRLRVDSRALFEQGQKLGLGSSAALCVALDTLLAQFPRRQEPAARSPTQRWAYLQALHSRAQGRRGSGADIAASLAGGVCVFEQHNFEHCRLQTYLWPADLHMAALWTGASASTPSFIGSWSAWRTRNPASASDLCRRLGEGVRRMAATTAGSDFVRAAKAYSRDLWDLEMASGIGIYRCGHDRAHQLAEAASDLCYKPCGAGGGDLGIALSTDPDLLQSFIARSGFRPVDIAPAPSKLNSTV